MGVWANEFAPNDVWFQQGYADDYDWWKNLTKPIPKTYGNALFNKGYNGQKVGFLWVDFTMRVVFDDIFPSEPPEQGDPWKAGVWYNVGDLVTYNGSTWKCVYAHTSYSHWYPGAPGLWFWQKQ
jgi:hypothetical protein